MNSTIFIPQKINVGFQERHGTYTGKLAYVIYFDEKGVLRKEASWNSWRSKKIDTIILDNEPISGFVLNKKAGGYDTGWNHRQTYVRIYDPRDFEFEITIPNLLYILENTNSIKGKGLDGEFVYGWDGKDLILIPTLSPDYIEISQYNNILQQNKKIGARDLKVGVTYLGKDNSRFVYMGKFEEYYTYDSGKVEKKGKMFFFYNLDGNRFVTYKSMSGKLIATLDENCIENYADIFYKLEGNSKYCPIDFSKNKYIPYTYEEFEESINNQKYWWYGHSTKLFEGNPKQISIWTRRFHEENYPLCTKQQFSPYDDLFKCETIKECYESIEPMYEIQYLQNGREYINLKGGNRKW